MILFEEFKSAYKTNHSTEFILLKVFNDIMLHIILLKVFYDIMLHIHSGSGTFLIFLDLSAVFDTIDYNVLCDVLQGNMSIYRTALDLFHLFLQTVNLWCASGISLGHIELSLHMLPLGTILKYLIIQYHIYAPDTQIYMSLS